MIDSQNPLSVRQQTKLLEICRSQVYYHPKSKTDDTEIANLIIDIYRENPMYGYRRITVLLRQQGYHVNRKRVLRLMSQMNLQAVYPKPKTTIRNRADCVYPYLLKGIDITRPHESWQVDITYLWTPHGFIYLFAVLDVYSRYLLSWRLSNTLDTQFCLDSVQDAIAAYGCPSIINSDQGCQFTSHDWVDMLNTHDIKISMCGQGRSNDNAYIERFWRTLKYEGVHLQNWQSVSDLKRGVRQFVQWYNTQRPHQSLDYETPEQFLYDHPELSDGFVHNLLIAKALNKLHTSSTGPTTTTVF